MKERLRCIEGILERSNIWIIRVPNRNKRKKGNNIQLYNGWAFFNKRKKGNNI